MTNDEANRLGKRIINTWRLTPPLTEWTDALTRFDYDHALTVFAQMRDQIDGPVSIARFVHEYRASVNPARTEPEPERDQLVTTYEQGIHIAAAAYKDECERQGRTPEWRYFHSTLYPVPMFKGRPLFE